MNSNFFNRKLSIILVLLSFAGQACQEEEDVVVENTALEHLSANATPEQLTMDSLFFFAKEVYLWNKDLPDYTTFAPRTYAGASSELKNLKKELFDISQYSLNPETGRAYEFVSSGVEYPKYSFLEEANATNGSVGADGLSGMSDLEGTAEDFGLEVSSVSATDVRIRAITTGSPADKAGLLRGDQVIKINNTPVRVDSKAGVDQITTSLDKPSITLSVKKASGVLVEVALDKAAYTLNPVLKSRVLSAGGSQVGYLAYGMFSNMKNSKAALEKAFASFAAAGVRDLVVDLRYNGGGYVATAEFLCNQIAPASLNNKVMYKELYNEMMQQGKARILENKLVLDENNAPIPYNNRNFTYADFDYSEKGNTHAFGDEGALESVRRVYFIIGNGTASSSELVINALMPHMEVTLIGATSYGKPVGFFGIDIGKYTVYMPNFRTVNAKDEGEYYAGFKPDVPAEDDVTRDFGNPEEAALSVALRLIKGEPALPGVAKYSVNGASDVASQPKALKHLGEPSGFKGMIEDRVPGAY